MFSVQKLFDEVRDFTKPVKFYGPTLKPGGDEITDYIKINSLINVDKQITTEVPIKPIYGGGSLASHLTPVDPGGFFDAVPDITAHRAEDVHPVVQVLVELLNALLEMNYFD